MKKLYSYELENNQTYFVAFYYLLVYILRELQFYQSASILLTMGVFISVLLLLIYSLTLNNYKVIPTKSLGLLIYWFRFSIKIAFYFLLMLFIPQTDSYRKFIIIILFIFITLEFAFLGIYNKYKHKLFYSFTDDLIDEYYKLSIGSKTYKKILGKNFKIFKFTFLLLYPISVWIATGGDFLWLLGIISIELLLLIIIKKN